MKRKLLILGIATLLLFSVTMAGFSMSEKDDKPPKVVPDTSTPEQVAPKSPDEPPVVTNVVVTPDKEGIPMPVFREAVIVYFKEMPVSIEEFASKYGVKLIFIKPNIKMAAFETRAIGEPGKTSQRTLDFINEFSKDSLVEKAFKDEFMFLEPDKVYTIDPRIISPADMKDKYVANEVVVGFWRLPPSLEEFASKYDAKPKNIENVLMFAVFETENITSFLEKVSTDPYISYAHPRGIGQYAYTPNDPKWNLQWGPRKIYAPEAWDNQKGSTSVTVAVLDSGVDYNHEDLSGRVTKGWNFVNNNSDPMDDNNHGTHVAGVIGAIMDNSKGIAGVAQVNILAVKIGDQYQPYPDLTAQGIRYAANNSAKVISMSLEWSTDYNEVRTATEYAWSKGSLLVAASGNGGSE